MPIEWTCTCGKKLAAPDAMAGKTGKCSQCGAVTTVPAPPIPGSEPEVTLALDADLGSPATRSCPYCSTRIPAAAAICVHCGETLDGSPPRAREPEARAAASEPALERIPHTAFWGWGLFGLGAVLGCAGAFTFRPLALVGAVLVLGSVAVATIAIVQSATRGASFGALLAGGQILFAMILIGGAAWSGFLSTALEGSRRGDCKENLERLGEAVLAYRKKNGGKLPALGNPTFFQELAKSEDLGDEIFLCPSSAPPRAANGGSLATTYRTWNSGTVAPERTTQCANWLLLVWDGEKVHGELRFVLFADGHTDELTEHEFRKTQNKCSSEFRLGK